MIQTTKHFMQLIKAARRDIMGKIQIDYTDPFLDQSINISANEQAQNSWLFQAADSVQKPYSKWASLDGTWKLDGSYMLAPDTEEAARKYQIGWWGTSLSGAGGLFSSPYPTLTAAFLARPIRKLKVVGDAIREEYPVDFVIRIYNQSDTLVHTETVTANTLITWEKDISDLGLLAITKMELEITKWSHVGRQAKIIEFFTSIQEIYYPDDISLIHLLEERDVSRGSLPIGNISANEIDIKINNTDRAFDADNASSPLYQLIKANRRIKAWLGFAGYERGENFSHIQNFNNGTHNITQVIDNRVLPTIRPPVEYTRASEGYNRDGILFSNNEPRFNYINKLFIDFDPFFKTNKGWDEEYLVLNGDGTATLSIGENISHLYQRHLEGVFRSGEEFTYSGWFRIDEISPEDLGIDLYIKIGFVRKNYLSAGGSHFRVPVKDLEVMKWYEFEVNDVVPDMAYAIRLRASTEFADIKITFKELSLVKGPKVPFSQGKRLLIERPTTNLLIDPLFKDFANTWATWIAYDNVVPPRLMTEGRRDFIRLEVAPSGTCNMHQSIIAIAGDKYSVAYEARLNSAEGSSYNGLYYHNIYYKPTGLSFTSGGYTSVSFFENEIDFEKLLPASDGTRLYKLIDSTHHLLGYVVDVNVPTKSVTFDRGIPVGNYENAYFIHVDQIYCIPEKTVQNNTSHEQNDWYQEKFENIEILNPKYNEHGAYENTSILFRIHHPTDRGYVDICKPQVEQLEQATSFTETSRADEQIFIPAIFEEVGTLEIAFSKRTKATDYESRDDRGLINGRDSSTSSVFSLTIPSWSTSLHYNGDAAEAVMHFENKYGTLVGFAMTWEKINDQFELNFYVDGEFVKALTVQDPLDTIKDLQLGNHYYKTNVEYDSFRVSSVIRNPEKILDSWNKKDYTPDQDTIICSDFINDLQMGGGGSWISELIDISSVREVATHEVSWLGTSPALARISNDGGATWGEWLEAEDEGPIPGLESNESVLDTFIQFKTFFIYEDIINPPSAFFRDLVMNVNNEEMIQLGVFWSGDWDVPESEVWASTSGRDRLDVLGKTTFSTSQILENISLYDLAVTILEDGGVTSEEYWIDSELHDDIIPYSWFDAVSHREALRKIAEASLGQVYQDRYGKIRVEGYSFLASKQEDPYEIKADDYKNKSRPAKTAEIANYVIVNTQPLKPTDLKEVFRSSENIIIGAGESKTKTIFYSEKPVMDAVATLEGATNTIIENVTYYVWGANIKLTNQGATGETCLIVVNGKTLEVQGAEQAKAEDANSIIDNGKIKFELPANHLIQTKELAQKIADNLLASFKDPRRDISLNWRGNPALVLADIIEIEEKYGDTKFYVTSQSLEWDGGLTATTEGRKK